MGELVERRERYLASAAELIVMPAALSSALKVLTLTPRFLASRNSSLQSVNKCIERRARDIET